MTASLKLALALSACSLGLPGTARAEGFSLKLGASDTSPPGAETTATPAAPAPEAPSSPPPQADQAPVAASPPAPLGKNPSHFEFAVVSVGMYQTWSLAGRVLSFGAGGGVGPALYRYGKIGPGKADFDNSLEILYANAFLRVSPARFMDVDVGPRIGLGSALYGVNDAPQTGFSVGGYADLRFGSERIKVGPRIEYLRVTYSEEAMVGWRITPLMLRVMR